MREKYIGIFSVNSVPYGHNVSVVENLMKEYHIGMTKGFLLSSLQYPLLRELRVSVVIILKEIPL